MDSQAKKDLNAEISSIPANTEEPGARKNLMSESSITKDCYNRRAVKHTHINIYKDI